MTEKKAHDWPRLALAALIMAYYGWALYNHYSEGLEETLKNIVMLAIGYWLGSSSGSKEKTDAMTHRPTGEPDDPVHVEED